MPKAATKPAAKTAPAPKKAAPVSLPEAGETLRVRLDHLFFGSEAVPPLNIRHPNDEAQIARLAASMRERMAEGKAALIEDLTVTPRDYPPGRYDVVDGGYRLAALRSLEAAGEIAPDLLLPCRVVPREEAYETSLAIAALALPLHPVDRYEAFAQAIASAPDRETGMARFARHHGLPLLEMRRIEALGALAPDVRKAWRAGKIDAETAKAFTIAPAEKQANALKDLLKRSWINAYAVRQTLTENRQRASDQDEAWRIAGAAYLDAGGTVTGDLFSEQRWVTDETLFASTLAAEKVSVCAAFKAAHGWGEVRWTADHAPGDGAIEQIDADDADALTREERAGLIAFVDINRQGEIYLECAGRRVIDSDEPDENAHLDDDDDLDTAADLVDEGQETDRTPTRMPTPAKPPGLDYAAAIGEGTPAAAAQALSLAVNEAVQALVASEPHLACTLLVAGWVSRHGGPYRFDGTAAAPLVIKANGQPWEANAIPPGTPFAEALERADALGNIVNIALDTDPLYEALAALIASTIDITHETITAATIAGRDRHVSPQAAFALLAWLTRHPVYSDLLESHARRIATLRAEALFASYSKAGLAAMLAEIDGESGVKAAAKAKKDVLIEIVASRTRDTGWIPAMLRKQEG
jgi:ParB-like chromosome segregation protein Spo0J